MRKHAIAAVPAVAEPSRRERKSRFTKADRSLLAVVRMIVMEFAKGRPIWKRRAELRDLAHQAVDHFFAMKAAGE